MKKEERASNVTRQASSGIKVLSMKLHIVQKPGFPASGKISSTSMTQ